MYLLHKQINIEYGSVNKLAKLIVLPFASKGIEVLKTLDAFDPKQGFKNELKQMFLGHLAFIQYVNVNTVYVQNLLIQFILICQCFGSYKWKKIKSLRPPMGVYLFLNPNLS